MGNLNKGKFLLSLKLSKIDFPSGANIKKKD